MKIWPESDDWAERPFWLWVYAVMLAVICAVEVLAVRGEL